MKKTALIATVLFVLLPSALADSAEEDCKKGNEAYCASRYEDALEYLDRAIKVKPDYAQAFEYRSYAHQGLNQIQPAINDLSQAIKLAPEKVSLRAARAQLYLKLNQDLAALKDLDWCVLHRQDPDIHIQDLLARAKLYEQLGKNEKAMADVLSVRQSLDNKKERKNSNSLTLYAMQLQALLSLDTHNFKKALTDADEIISKTPKDSYNDEIYAIRARALAGTGEDTKALRDLNQAISIISSGSSGDPFEQRRRDLRQAKDYIEAAHSNERLKNLDAAIDCISKAIKLDPLNIGFYLNRQRLFLAIGELALANEDKKKILDLRKEAEKSHEN